MNRREYVTQGLKRLVGAILEGDMTIRLLLPNGEWPKFGRIDWDDDD